ncbi:MAG TPA: chemotaxis protein CheW [Streptosporangiaceae bacterium]|nr:chemotaxis protein CheW [Streptosporangiaceae bacterium]
MGSYVRLKAAGEAYAVPVEHVLEAAELGRVRAVPGARPELLGIKSVRGQILPVADLGRLLGADGTAPPGSLLVAEALGFRVGFAIDQVTGVGELGELDEDTESRFLAGTTLSDGELVGVVDMPRVFESLDGTRR